MLEASLGFEKSEEIRVAADKKIVNFQNAAQSPVDFFSFTILHSLYTMGEKPLEVFFNLAFLSTIKKYIESVCIRTAADLMAESGLEQLKRSFSRLYQSCLDSVKVLFQRMKIIKFSYNQAYESNIMFSDIMKGSGVSSDKANSVYQFEITKCLLTIWLEKIKKEGKYLELTPIIVKLVEAESSRNIYSYFEGPENLFPDPEHYDHFLESVIEGIL